MRINHNIAALNTYRQLNSANTAQGKSMEKLSSGLRINRAGDDAAGLAISEKMRGQIRGLDQASKNSQDGISMIQTAEGALNETQDILQRMRELAVQSSNDTNTNTDRKEIQKEVDQLAQEITRISNTTEFNTQNLMAGGLDVTFHIGANKGQNMGVKVNAMDAFSLGVATGAKTGSVDAGNNTAQISGLKDVGEGLTDPSYTLLVTKNGASFTGVTGGDIDTVTGGTSPTASLTGAYTGRENTASATSIQIKVTGVNDGGTGGDSSDDRINEVTVSFDGGTTWSSAKTVNGTDALDIGQGIQVSFADTEATVDGIYKFGATASTASIQLAEADGVTTIGNAVTVRNDATSATVGDASVYKDLGVDFNFATLVTSTGTNTQFAVTTDSSRSATFKNDGTIDLEAKAAAGINVSSQDKANSAIDVINKAIETVSSERSKLGAVQNRLEHTINNLNTSSENLTAAESRIRDVDYALAA